MSWKMKQHKLSNFKNREKTDKKNEQRLQDLWGYNKRASIFVIGTFEEKGKEGGFKSVR